MESSKHEKHENHMTGTPETYIYIYMHENRCIVVMVFHVCFMLSCVFTLFSCSCLVHVFFMCAVQMFHVVSGFELSSQMPALHCQRPLQVYCCLFIVVSYGGILLWYV